MMESTWRGLIGTIRESYRQSLRLAEVVAPKRSTPEGERIFRALAAVSNALSPFGQAQNAAVLTQPWAAKYLARPDVVENVANARQALKGAVQDAFALLTGRADGEKFNDGFEFGMLDPVLVLLQALPGLLRDARARPSAVDIAIAMKRLEPTLSTRKAAETVGINQSKLQRKSQWRDVARESLKERQGSDEKG